MSNVNGAVNERLRDVLKELVYTGVVLNQADLATKLHMSRSHISEMMSGKKPVTDAMVSAMRIRFGVSEQYLKFGFGAHFEPRVIENPHKLHIGRVLKDFLLVKSVTEEFLCDELCISRDDLNKQFSKPMPDIDFIRAFEYGWQQNIDYILNVITSDRINDFREKYPEFLDDDEGENLYMTEEEIASVSQVKESNPKEVIPLGKQAHSRLQPGQYKDAFASWGGLPMYNMPITASFIASYRDEQGIIPQYYFYDPRFRDCDFGAIITGDSMHSEIRHGDFIALKEITDMNFVVFGDIYYIVAKNGLETCKYLNADPRDPEAFLLVPKNEKISPSPIKKDMVLKMYKVRGIIRGY